MDETVGITFIATLVRVTTTADGGWRVAFDVGQDGASSLLELAKLRDRALQLAAIPVPQNASIGAQGPQWQKT